MTAYHVDQVVIHDRTVKAAVMQRLNHIGQVSVAGIGEGFVESARLTERSGYVPDMELEQLLFFDQVVDEFHRGAAGERTAFQPAADTQTYTDMIGVGDLQSLLVTFEVTEDTTGDTGDGVNGRIIGMNANVLLIKL